MKKAIRLVIVAAGISILFSACKSHEKCPAYGQIAKPKLHSSIRG